MERPGFPGACGEPGCSVPAAAAVCVRAPLAPPCPAGLEQRPERPQAQGSRRPRATPGLPASAGLRSSPKTAAAPGGRAPSRASRAQGHGGAGVSPQGRDVPTGPGQRGGTGACRTRTKGAGALRGWGSWGSVKGCTPPSLHGNGNLLLIHTISGVCGTSAFWELSPRLRQRPWKQFFQELLKIQRK